MARPRAKPVPSMTMKLAPPQRAAAAEGVGRQPGDVDLARRHTSTTAPERVVGELGKFGGEVLQTNLPTDAEHKLQEALDAAKSASN